MASSKRKTRRYSLLSQTKRTCWPNNKITSMLATSYLHFRTNRFGKSRWRPKMPTFYNCKSRYNKSSELRKLSPRTATKSLSRTSRTQLFKLTNWRLRFQNLRNLLKRLTIDWLKRKSWSKAYSKKRPQPIRSKRRRPIKLRPWSLSCKPRRKHWSLETINSLRRKPRSNSLIRKTRASKTLFRNFLSTNNLQQTRNKVRSQASQIFWRHLCR